MSILDLTIDAADYESRALSGEDGEVHAAAALPAEGEELQADPVDEPQDPQEVEASEAEEDEDREDDVVDDESHD